MDLFILVTAIAVCYVLPVFWSFYIAYKTKCEFYGIFALIPMMNVCLVLHHYDEVEQNKRQDERRRKGEEEINATTEFYYIEIEFLDGQVLKTPKVLPYWSEWEERVISSKKHCEEKIRCIISREYYQKGNCKFPYHTMSAICIKEFKE